MHQLHCHNNCCTHKNANNHNLHQSNGNIVKDVIQPGAVEHSVVSKIMLQPASLSLCSAHAHGRDDPSGPRVAKVPEHPPGSHLEEDNVSKKGHKEPRIDFEISLQITEDLLLATAKSEKCKSIALL